ncbi:hypothetical protein KIN20_029496 [Parelaphostrongylus tenuis]|uniref:Uncharacterized protein n=1 Tax=Parelaphostrongylus tenuis TaxID=148309 RepID=A0AAD5WFJ3_PARTN|nr:hypothetical protein KIN20_029496 [Parelaphostrongylus tenuis]
MDSKGNYRPDIGSIIAYALSTVNYEKNQQKEEDCVGEDQTSLNPNATNVVLDEEPPALNTMRSNSTTTRLLTMLRSITQKNFVFYANYCLLRAKKHLHGLCLKVHFGHRREENLDHFSTKLKMNALSSSKCHALKYNRSFSLRLTISNT